MKLISAFFRLVRLPNLFFIVLTQSLFYYCILMPVMAAAGETRLHLYPLAFWLLVLSSVLIAAAGYIINDYFDLNIDQVNKPESIVVQKFIRRRSAIIWHMSFSIAGVLLAFYIGIKIGNWILGFANLVCVLLLWVYSTTFKRKLLIGNIIISLLTAWVVLVLYFCELSVLQLRDPVYRHQITSVFKLAILYGGYAFIISLIREVVKDIEDREGDARYGCHTMPIVWGVDASKGFIAIWLIILIITIGLVIVYAVMKGWWIGSVYSILFILFPLLNISRALYKANEIKDYHKLSSQIKMVMLSGILSMIFFKWYL